MKNMIEKYKTALISQFTDHMSDIFLACTCICLFTAFTLLYSNEVAGDWYNLLPDYYKIAITSMLGLLTGNYWGLHESVKHKTVSSTLSIICLCSTTVLLGIATVFLLYLKPNTVRLGIFYLEVLLVECVLACYIKHERDKIFKKK